MLCGSSRDRGKVFRDVCCVQATGRPLPPDLIGGTDPVVLSKMIQYGIVLGSVFGV